MCTLVSPNHGTRMTRGWGDIQAHHGTLIVLAGKGANAGLLPGTNQEHIGCGPVERGPTERGKGIGFSSAA